MTDAPATNSATNALILYDAPPSPCARRVRITLLEKGLPWETVEIDLTRLEQRRPEYLAINPNGFVPALAHGGRILHESNVITEYLDDVFPATPLYPADPALRAQVHMWQEAELSMAKDYRMIMYARVMGPILRLTRSHDEAIALAKRATSDPADLAWEDKVYNLQVLTPAEEQATETRLIRWLEVLEGGLQGRDWLVGTSFSQADISVYPRVAMYGQLHIKIRADRWPNVAAWMRRCAARPSFARSQPAMAKTVERLNTSPLLPWARDRMNGIKQPNFMDKAAMTAVGKLLRRVLKVDALLNATDAPERPINRPDATIVPAPTTRSGFGTGTTSDMPLTLMGDLRSPHTRRLNHLLTLKGVPFEMLSMDLTRLDHKTRRFKQINPLGAVPALTHGDLNLYDSAAIANYVDDTFNGFFVGFPQDAYETTQVRLWLALESGTHKEFRPLLWTNRLANDLGKMGVTHATADEWINPDVAPEDRDWLYAVLDGRARFDTSPTHAANIINQKLAVLENHLADHDWLVGTRPSFADLAWGSRLDSFPDMGLTLDKSRYPGVARFHKSYHDLIDTANRKQA